MSNSVCHRSAFICFITALGLLFVTQVKAAANDTPDILALGSVAMDIPAEMVKRLTPLTQYLSKQTGIAVNFRASPNLDSAVEDIGKNITQIAYLTPAAYLEAREKYSVIPLVSPLSKGKGTFTLVIAVQKDSPLKTMSDLKGKKFAFGDKKAKLQPAVVVSSGFKLEDFASYDYLNHYDNIAKAIINGDFDAGILKDSVAKDFASGLRVIHSSPPLPNYIFVVNKDLPPDTINKLKKAMLSLKPDTEDNKAILLGIEKGYDGFEVASDKDFNGIRKVLGKK